LTLDWLLDRLGHCGLFARLDHLEVAPVAITGMKMSVMGVKTGNLGIPNLIGARLCACKMTVDRMD
jgi:hypothetical protein